MLMKTLIKYIGVSYTKQLIHKAKFGKTKLDIKKSVSDCNIKFAMLFTLQMNFAQNLAVLRDKPFH